MKILKNTLLAFLALIIICVTIPFFIDLNSYKATLLTYVRENTPFDVRIDGPIKLSLLPLPNVQLANVSVYPAAATQNKPILHVDEIDLAADVLALLRGTIAVQHITLNEPKGHFDAAALAFLGTLSKPAETNKTPGQNAHSAPTQKDKSFAIDINTITIKNGNLFYSKDGQIINVSSIHITGSLHQTNAQVKGTFAVDGLPVIPKNTSFAIDASHIKNALTAHLQTTGTSDKSPFALDVSLSSPDAFNIANHPLTFSKFAITLNDAKVWGKGHYSIKNNNGSVIFSAINNTLLSLTANKNIPLTGNAIIDLSKDKPFLTLNAAVPLIDLRSGKSAAPATENNIGVPGQTTAPATTPMPTYTQRFSKDPIDLSALHSIDGRITLTLQKIYLDALSPNTPLKDVVIKINLANGHMTIPETTIHQFGGTISAGIVVEAPKPAKKAQPGDLKAHITAKLSNIDLGKMPMLVGTPVKSGKATLTVSANLTGASVYTLMNNLNGKTHINVTDAIVEGFDIKNGTESLKKIKGIDDLMNIKSAFEKKADMHVHKITGDFDLTPGGIARTNNTAIESNEGSILTKGTVNFDTSMLDLNANVTVKNVQDLPPLSINIKGSMQSPNVTLDQKQLQSIILKMVSKQAINQVTKQFTKTGGGIVGALVDGLTNKGKKSDNAAAQSDQKSDQQEPANDSPSQQEDLAKNAIKGLTSLFGR